VLKLPIGWPRSLATFPSFELAVSLELSETILPVLGFQSKVTRIAAEMPYRDLEDSFHILPVDSDRSQPSLSREVSSERAQK